MTSTINDISLLPWQSTVLIWAGGTIGVLLLTMIVMMFMNSRKKDVKKKTDTVLCCFFAFIIAVILANTAAISFLVDVELGWKLSLVAGVSIIVCVISIVGMLLGMFGQMSTKMFWLWMFLSMISFASVINLVVISLGGQ